MAFTRRACTRRVCARALAAASPCAAPAAPAGRRGAAPAAPKMGCVSAQWGGLRRPRRLGARRQPQPPTPPLLLSSSLAKRRTPATDDCAWPALARAWGDPIEWAPATVASVEREADGLHTVDLDVGPAAAALYTIPGQYVQVRVGGDDAKPGFFAVASAPGDARAAKGVLQLLLKEGGGAADAIIASPPGAAVDVSPVQGKGFALDRIPPSSVHTLLLFATGSGVAPIRAAMLSGALDAKARRDVRFYYGTRSPSATAFASEAAAWRAAGVRVIPVHSDDADDYVQDVFAKEGGLADGSKTGALLCGHKGMCDDVKALLAAAGVPDDAVLLNF